MLLKKIAPSKRCFGSLFSVLIVFFLPVLITYLLSGFEFTEGVQVVIIINFWFTIAGVIASFFRNISWGLHHDIYRKFKIEYPENLLFSFCQFAHAVMLPFIIFFIGMLITYRLN